MGTTARTYKDDNQDVRGPPEKPRRKKTPCRKTLGDFYYPSFCLPPGSFLSSPFPFPLFQPLLVSVPLLMYRRSSMSTKFFLWGNESTVASQKFKGKIGSLEARVLV